MPDSHTREKLHKKRVIIELEPHSVLPLREAAGATVECLKGVLWITQQDDPNDVVVEQGGSFVVKKNGDTLIQPLQGARIAIEAVDARLAADSGFNASASRVSGGQQVRGALTAAVLSMLGLLPRLRVTRS